MFNIKFLLVLLLIITLILLIINCFCKDSFKNQSEFSFESYKNNLFNVSIVKDKIPLIIHKTGPDNYNNLSKVLLNNFNKTKLQNPDYKIIYYDDNDCYNLIKTNFKSDILWAYEKLKPTAYKADLFRYCVLYLYGGIYSDLTQTFLTPLNNIIDHNKDKLILCSDWGIDIQISFICTIPKNNIFIKVIDEIIKNCKNNYYGDHFLSVTGPKLFKNILDKYDTTYIIKLFQTDGFLIDKNGKKIIKCKHKDHHKIVYSKKKHYAELWKNKDIYNF